MNFLFNYNLNTYFISLVVFPNEKKHQLTNTCMFTLQVQARFFEAHFQTKSAFIAMDGDKRHWLPIRSLMLMFD